MCQVLRDEFLLLEPCRKAGLNFIEGAFERAVGGVTIWKCGGEAWAQEPVVGAGEEQGSAEAKGGDAGAEAAGCPACDAALEDELNVLGTAGTVARR